MESIPVPTIIKHNVDGDVIGWTNAFGTYELSRGITKRVGEGSKNE